MDKETTTTELWPEASRSEMDEIFQLCRNDDWNRVLHRVKTKPWIAITPMIMDNHIATTVMHQAITSKGSTKLRAQLIRQILTTTPQAAAIKNGYGSLPLHVIAQRNTKMDAPTKESLIFDLVAAHEGALIEEGGVGKRTPLHIIFTGKNRQNPTLTLFWSNQCAHISIFFFFIIRLHLTSFDADDD